MNNVIDETTAAGELENIQAMFDVAYDGEDKKKILPAIQEGRLMCNEDESLVDYTLVESVELKNGESIASVKIRVPSFVDLEYINRGFQVKVDKNGDTVMDFASTMQRTIRAVGRLTNIPAGIVDRVSRKDMRVMGAMLNFFD